MAKTMDLIKFRRLVTSKGFQIISTTKHHAIVDEQGRAIMHFAISHGQGSKKEVLGCYIKEFLEKIS